MTEFTKKLLEVASKEVGVREVPLGSNRGPQVDEYIKRVGLDPEGRWPWCAAFVYWCFNEAFKTDKLIDLDNLVRPPKTAGAIDHWNKSHGRKLTPDVFKRYPELVTPGCVFILDEGHGLGHMGLIESTAECMTPKGRYMLTTIEGNTNEDGSRNGIGVFRRKRYLDSINKGIINYE